MAIPVKVADRLSSGLKRFQPILLGAKARDVNESDTSMIVTDMMADLFGYDKYSEVTREHCIRGTYCDLATRIDGKLQMLIEVKGDDDVGLLAMPSALNPLQTTFKILPAVPTEPGDGFSRLVEHIDEFFEQAPERPLKSFNQVVYCLSCRQLQLIRMRDEYLCPNCGSDLVAQ